MKKKKVALFNYTRHARHCGCQLSMINLEKKLNTFGIEVVWKWPAGKDWRRDVAAIPRHPEIDAILVNGEGSIHHSHTRSRPEYLSLLGGFARQELNLPAFLINATVYENSAGVYENLKDFDGIFVRESFSQKQLHCHGIRAHVVPDLTFAYAPLVHVAEKRAGVCGIDSVVPEISNAIRRLCLENTWIYTSIRYPETRLPFLDVLPWEGAKNILKKCIRSIDEHRKVHSFNALICSQKFVLSGRFHGVTLCLLSGTPFVAFDSNTPKISWLLQDVVGQSNRVLSLDELTRTDVSSYFYWTDTEKQQIKDYCAAAL